MDPTILVAIISAVVSLVGTAPETLDSIALDATITDGTQSTSRGTYFDAETRKLITVVTGLLNNTTTSAIDVTETGVTCGISAIDYGSYDYSDILIVRDLLPETITVPTGKSLSFNYTFEMLYPA